MVVIANNNEKERSGLSARVVASVEYFIIIFFLYDGMLGR